jgi:chaperonin cofactor prefoldin
MVGTDLTNAVAGLERKVKLLLSRHSELTERYDEVVAASERLGVGLDPVALEERVQVLETERDRLSQHAAFLEGKIRELLTRVRYAVDA